MNGSEALLSSHLWAWVVHPGLLLGGALLAAVPLAIHWWSRRRVRTVEWAAMRLLAGAWRREERRTRLEDRALLALRVLAVLAAAVVVARPLQSVWPFAWTAAGHRGDRVDREWIVLLDDSLSMKTSGAAGSAFDQAKQRLREFIEARTSAGQDTLTLLAATAPTAPRWERVPLAAARVDELLAAVDRLSCTDAAVDWPATLTVFRRWLNARPATRHTILVCSDYRARDWDADSDAAASKAAGDSAGANAASAPEIASAPEVASAPEAASAAEAASRSDGSESWWLCDVGDPAEGNVLVASLDTSGPVAAGVPFDYLVAVRNTGPRSATAVRVRLSAADTALQELTLDQLAPGETRTIAFPVRLGESTAAPRPAEIQVELSLDSPELHNRLAADDTALDTLVPVPAVAVALVASGATDSSDHVPFVENALAPAGPFATGFAVRRSLPNELTAEALEATRVVIWEDIAALPLPWLERLEAWVAGGGALVLVPGPDADPQTWRERLWRDGQGLAPGNLRAIQGDPSGASWRGWGTISPGYAAGRILDRAENPLIDRVKIFRWWDIESPTANVLARFAGSAAAPAIVEHPYGAGRVVLLAFPPRTAWTDWPLDPSFVIYWQELAQACAADRILPQRPLAGTSLRLALPTRRYQASAWLRTPGKTREPLDDETAEALDANSARLDHSARLDRFARWNLTTQPLLQTGAHVLELTETSGRRTEHPFSVLADPREGELQRVASQWRPTGLLATARRVPPDMPWTAIADGPREWWWWAACGLAAILAAEQSLAWNLGRRR